MCSLRLKLQIAGRKNHKFTKIVVLRNHWRMRGRTKLKIGYWNTLLNPVMVPRNIVFNVRKYMYFYMYGASANRKVMNFIYYYFLSKAILSKDKYFSKLQIKYFLYHEINNKKF